LNKHLPHILLLIKKKQDLASVERIHELKCTLISNGGSDAEKFVKSIELK